MTIERRKISSGSPWETTFGYSRAVHAGDQVFVGGTVGINPDGSAAPGPYAQARRALEIIGTAMTEAGGSSALIEPAYVLEIEVDAVIG